MKRNCMDCEHAWCKIVPSVAVTKVERGLLCKKLDQIVWQGKTYPTFVYTDKECPLGEDLA
jgi:hypothetical protein